jgi:hypothetical protein
MSQAASPRRTYSGGCHCRAVRFEVDAAQPMAVIDCNCSICSMTGFLHLVVPASRFRLLSGRDVLETYTFETGVARHHFCRRCGIKSFYVPRSNPDGFSINVRCLDGYPGLAMQVESFDGRHWEASPAIRNLSLENPEKT